MEQTKQRLRIWIVMFSITILSSACSEVQFEGSLAGNYQLENSAFFPLSDSQASFKQISSFNNEVNLQLSVTQVGTNITGLNKDLIQISHNGVNINNFNIVNTSTQTDNIIDIAFVIDVTGTMSEFIEDAKARIINFIQTSMKSGIRTRMCFSTFGDYTVKKCDRFYDNDPKNPATIVQTQELISEISNLRAFKGAGQDPGWPDFDENPMRAIIDVSQAPFRTEAQKFVILVTDSGFLYSPQNQGSVGTLAPFMTEVADAIKASQITIFGITPYLAGYTSPLNSVPGIIEQSSGEHYLFKSVIDGDVTLNQILNRILDRVNASYVLTYVIDNFPNIDPKAPVNSDSVQIKIKDASDQTTTINDIKVTATFPDGRPAFIQEWKLSAEKIKPSSVDIWVNGIQLSDNEFVIENGSIKVSEPPALSSTILVRYQYEDDYRNLRLKPIYLNRILSDQDVIVTLNGIPARDGDVLFQRTLQNDLSIMILPVALRDDFYSVKANLGVQLEALKK